MKNLYVLLLAIAMTPFAVNAQFFEDFEDVPLTEGLGSLPEGWTAYDEDGNTPYTDYSYITDAWIVAEYSSQNGNAVAVSTSYYTPAGQSNDWMVTPEITVPATDPFLIFEAMAPNQTFADDYEVLISTTGNTPADFTTVIYSETTPPATLTASAVDLSAYAGQLVYIAFRNVANDELLLFMDNIQVKTLADNDAGVIALQLNDEYSEINTDNTLDITIQNFGKNVINSVDVAWSDGTDTYSETFTGLNLQPYTTTTFSHNTPVNASSVLEKTITVTASNINGETDPELANNTAITFFHTVSSGATKHVVIEEGTGTWCGWCPRGIVAMEHMYENEETFPNFIGIAVHNGDPMVVPEYNAGANFSGFPGSNVGRVLLGVDVNTSAWEGYYNTRKDNLTAAEVSITATYDEEAQEITSTVTSEFFTDFTAENQLALSVVVVENGVTGTDAGYSQTNYYTGGGQGVMGGFESLPLHIPAEDMVYDRVGTALLGGYNGELNSVPGEMVNGGTSTYSFTYTLPADSNPNEIFMVALLIDQSSGAILNASEVDLVPGLGVENPVAVANIQVYPNPASEFVNISFGMEVPTNVNLNVYSLSGALVKSQSFEDLSGQQSIQLDVSTLAAGEYLVSLSTNKGAVVKTIIVK